MKVKSQFPLFDSHLDLAHSYWQELLTPDSWAIDATCGNGFDTLFLTQHCRGVIAIDIQREALQNTEQLFLKNPEYANKVHLFCQSHTTFPDLAYAHSISLITYNLGYLPGGNKELTTLEASTLDSLQVGMECILPQGVISVTAYPGHLEGKKELECLLSFISTLDPKKWSSCTHIWNNRKNSPVLILLQKN